MADDGRILAHGHGSEEHLALSPEATATTVGNGTIESGNRDLRSQRVEVTAEDSNRICRKTDKVVLTILVWGYFLQILDKTVLGYGALFGLPEDNKLTGREYSLVSSAAPIAQLAWQPFSSYLIVRVPHRILFPALVFFWGASQAGMAACNSFGSLFAARLLLGLFEAGCFPLFSILVGQWYRRAEHPMRIAAFYSTNGIATIVAAVLTYALAQVDNPPIAGWRILFVLVGGLTVVSAFPIWYLFPDDVPTAWFLTEHERLQAVERLRANQSGAVHAKFSVSHLVEAVLEPKSYLWIALVICLNVGAMVTNTFGPLILRGLGLDADVTTLLNMPFGAMQVLTIILCAWLCQKFRLKSPILMSLVVPPIVGFAVLYTMPRDPSHVATNLVGYYLVAFLFGGNAPLAAWMVGNTGGSTKKSVVMSLYNAASATGNIIGPLLFTTDDAPEYLPGLRAVLGMTAAFAGLVLIQLFILRDLNRRQQRRRVANGKPAIIHDNTLDSEYSTMEAGSHEEGSQGLNTKTSEDLTDGQNDEFIYIY